MTFNEVRTAVETALRRGGRGRDVGRFFYVESVAKRCIGKTDVETLDMIERLCPRRPTQSDRYFRSEGKCEGG